MRLFRIQARRLRNSRDGVPIPDGPTAATKTTYSWVSAPDASTVSTPGIKKADVTVTLPKGAQTKENSHEIVPVTIKVRPYGYSRFIDVNLGFLVEESGKSKGKK